MLMVLDVAETDVVECGDPGESVSMVSSNYECTYLSQHQEHEISKSFYDGNGIEREVINADGIRCG